MSRPQLTKELIAATAATFCEQNGFAHEAAADIASVWGNHMDGYGLAKELERQCGWSPTAQDVEELDGFYDALRNAHRKACIAWARENNIQPPLPIGTMTTRGEITGIYAYDGACYEIRIPGDADPTRRRIMRFEDAREAHPAATAMMERIA